MTKHTPGEWFHDKGKKPWTVRDEQGAVIAICPIYKLQGIERSRDELEANTKLIADSPKTAAERDRLKAVNAELLAAMNKILEWTDGTRPLGDELWLEMVEIARLAIAKAEGRD